MAAVPDPAAQAAGRMWSADGLTGTVTLVDAQGVHVRLDGPAGGLVLAEPARWMPALTCEYCDQPAELQLIDGQDGDVLCRSCAGGQFAHAADWVRPIPKTVIRRLFQHYRRLG